jgi:protein TonB
MFRSVLHLLRHAATRLVLPALLLAAPAALAQTTAPAAPTGLNPYTGPRFGGGPDSLQAMLRRAVASVSPALTGQLFVRVELNKNGQATRCYVLMPSDRAGTALTRSKEVKAIIQQLPTLLGTWQLGTSSANDQSDSSIILPLYFGPQPAPIPLAYSDENPAFVSIAATKNSPPVNVVKLIQRQFRYPAEDLRNRVQGTAYGYYEVSETGAVENRRIISGLSPTVDAELLYALNTLPDARTPPRQQGRPVRVAYVVPINLRIQ